MCANTVKSAPSCPKRVLAILGSPRPAGVSAQLLDAFLEALPEADVTRFSCYERPPIPCDDCRYCTKREGCSKRDLDSFYEALEEADLLVIATPVYHLSFPAPLKALIDRLQRYWSARFLLGRRPPIAKEKRLVLLTSSGSAGTEGGPFLERQLAPPLTVIHASPAATVHAVNADSPDFDAAPWLEKARQAAVSLIR